MQSLLININAAFPRGNWQDLEFKEYNFNALGQPTEAGHLHPLLKVMLPVRSCVIDVKICYVNY